MTHHTQLTADNVNEIFCACLGATQDDDRVMVKGLTLTAGFSKHALDRYTENIVAMLAELPAEFHEQSGGGMSFIYGTMNRDGRQWGEQHHVEELIMLGIGINRVKFQFPRDLWPSLPGGLPYVVVTAAPHNVQQ